jgi:hypothetical protein
MAASGRLLVALCVAALLAVRPEAHGLEDFTGGNTQATPAMESFFGAKPEAAQLPEALPAKPEAASAIPTTTDSSTATATTNDHSRSVSVAAGVACGVAAVAVVGVAAAVAYVVRSRRGAARRESAVQLGASP